MIKKGFAAFKLNWKSTGIVEIKNSQGSFCHLSMIIEGNKKW